jgi:hypothetical protein
MVLGAMKDKELVKKLAIEARSIDLTHTNDPGKVLPFPLHFSNLTELTILTYQSTIDAEHTGYCSLKQPGPACINEIRDLACVSHVFQYDDVFKVAQADVKDFMELVRKKKWGDIEWKEPALAHKGKFRFFLIQKSTLLIPDQPRVQV